jgi:hypothetical protein
MQALMEPLAKASAGSSKLVVDSLFKVCTCVAVT